MIDMIAVIACLVVVYVIIAAAVMSLVGRLRPRYRDDGDDIFAGVLWPLAVPAMVAYVGVGRVFDALDSRRKAAAKVAEDLKRTIRELDEELAKHRPEGP
jgi:hypothetical protein